MRYEANPAVQAEAARIAHALAERMPLLLDMLLAPIAPGAPRARPARATLRLLARAPACPCQPGGGPTRCRPGAPAADARAACPGRRPAACGAPVTGQPRGRAGEPPAYQRLRSGYAALLDDAVAGRGAYVADDNGGDGAGDGDGAGGLVLALLQACADAPAPNLAHALSGYDVEAGAGGLAASALDPRRTPGCLAPLLAGLAAGGLETAQPGLYEGALALLHRLAASPEAGPPLLDLLRAERVLPDQLAALAALPLPPHVRPPPPCARPRRRMGLPPAASPEHPRAQGPERATALHQRAWLLQLAALELHSADAALPAHREALEELLAVLFLPADAPGARTALAHGRADARRGRSPAARGRAGDEPDGARRGGVMAGLLEAAVYPIERPQLSHEAGPEVCRLQQARRRRVAWRSRPLGRLCGCRAGGGARAAPGRGRAAGVAGDGGRRRRARAVRARRPVL